MQGGVIIVFVKWSCSGEPIRLYMGYVMIRDASPDDGPLTPDVTEGEPLRS